MDEKYSYEFRCSNRVTIIATNHINHYILAKPVILEVDPDCILHTEPVTMTTGYEDKFQAVHAALSMMDEVELAILELTQETPIGGIEPGDLNWLSTDEDLLFNAKQELGL